MAKTYQVRQVLEAIDKLANNDDESYKLNTEAKDESDDQA